MPDFIPRLPGRPSFEQLQKQAKELLRDSRSGIPQALARFQAAGCQPQALADAQFVLAREHGFETWAKLKHFLEAREPSRAEQYELLASALVKACHNDPDALRRLMAFYGGVDVTNERLRSVVEDRLRAISSAGVDASSLKLDQARLFIARQNGFENWAKMMQAVAPPGLQSAPPFYRIDWRNRTLTPGPLLSDRDWDAIFDVMREHGITSLNANGRMTNAGLDRLGRFGAVTRLNLDGSLQITDAGLAHLSRLPDLQELDLSGWKGQITDEGLRVIRDLSRLRRFKLCWQQNVSDTGLANLASCEALEEVNLMGTPAGDGTIRALGGKTRLRSLRTGRAVSDAGIPLLHQLPLFQTWHGGELTYSLMSADAGPTHLVLDGPFTNAGLQALAGLDGLFGLSFFWHCPAFTSDGLQVLASLPNLGFLGCQDQHCDDEAMHHIARIPRLRMLMGQGAVASDVGFHALSRSKTLEYIWGRECPNLSGSGFAALASLPALRGLALSCKNSSEGLSLLPHFPALREFMPMDVADDGFRHVGQCTNLEALWCMYCRDTGDLATEHIADLNLRSYYAGKTLITDRSLEILSRMATLERLEFWQCEGITNAGVAQLAALPRLTEISLDGLAGVTRDAEAFFGPAVRVNYSS